MSAYQVSQDTIDLMVSVLVEWRGYGSPYVYTYGKPPTDPELVETTEIGRGYNITRADRTTADALGRELIDANVASLMARYDGSYSSPGVECCSYFGETYTWRRVFSDDVTPHRAMGAVKCYRYQACEHDEWRGSFADELSNAVLMALVDMVADGWEYERPADAPQVVSIMDLISKNKGGN